MSETFTPRCSFGTARRFRISPASYVDLTQSFSRRGFPSLPCLRRCVKYLTNVQSPKEKGRELQISSQFDAIFSTATRAFVCKVRLSIGKRGSFSLGPIGARPFPNLTLLTYISMTKCLRRYRAVDTKTERNAIGTEEKQLKRKTKLRHSSDSSLQFSHRKYHGLAAA